MTLSTVKALTFDTGGTVLDWYTGFRRALEQAGARHHVERDWPALANELRRASMEMMLNLGEVRPPDRNFDDAHRICLDEVLLEHDLHVFDDADRRLISWQAPHSFDAWPDVAAGLEAIRRQRMAVSFSILSYRLIIDTSRHNRLTWDAVLSCEGLGVYKLAPAAYSLAAKRLQLEPNECCMVACHPFDLDAAKAVGFQTALVRRPAEWGTGREDVATPPSAEGTYDIEVDDFQQLARAFEMP